MLYIYDTKQQIKFINMYLLGLLWARDCAVTFGYIISFLVLCNPVRGTEQYFIARQGETLSHCLEITVKKCRAHVFTEIDSSTVQLHLPAALDSITFDSSEN